VANAREFRPRETVSIGSGANRETALIVSTESFGPPTLTFSAPLAHAHAVGAPISGSGVTLTAPLSGKHASGTQVAGSAATPGDPNHYYKASH